MDSEDKELPAELTDEGCPIDMYTDERIAEFLAEDKLTAEQKKMLEEKLSQPKAQKW